MPKNLDLGIDAAALIESVRPEMALQPPRAEDAVQQGDRPPTTGSEGRPQTRSPSAKNARQGLVEEYQRQFVKKSDFNAHSGKTCYMRPRYHERISQIVEILGKGVSISAYLDNVLYEHFEKYGEAVDTLFKQKFNEILKKKETEE